MTRITHARLVASLIVILASMAGAQERDTSAASARFLSLRDARVLGVGLLTSAAVTPFDVRIARWVQAPAVQGSAGRARFVGHLTRVNETTLAITGIAAYATGRLTHGHATADIALHATEAVVVTSVVSQLIRGPLGRSRPSFSGHTDQYDFHFMQGFSHFTYRAFPSLHAATAYAAGAALVGELRERHPAAVWYGAPLIYTAASLPGLSRVYLDQHWASDVVMGGVVGVLFGSKVVRYAHGHPTTRLDRLLLGTDVAPSGDGRLEIMMRKRF